MKRESVHIIGAGVSGLVCAIVLEKAGFSPVILEASDKIGGRLKTEMENGYPLDHGFQVLLTGYPSVKKYLNLKELNLIKLLPGAAVFRDGNQFKFGDPIRCLGFLPHLFLTKIASQNDKWKIFRLQAELKQLSVEEIFQRSELTTLEYLNKRGFSEQVIKCFFRPFYGGIFLESKLTTSSRMFEFVFKMFAEGNAAIPKGGMSEIPKQLFQKLNKTEIKYNSKVISIGDGILYLDNGDKLSTDNVVMAAEPPKNFLKSSLPEVKWKSCYNLYFEVDNNLLKKGLIGLCGNEGKLINNMFYPFKAFGIKKEHLISLTVIDFKSLEINVLINNVIKELEQDYGIQNPTFIKSFFIPKALPVIKDLKYKITEDKVCVSPGLFIAGDTQSNSSLNAAMLSGEVAANAIINKQLKINLV